MDPVKVENLDPADEKELMTLFDGNDEGFLYFGDNKYVMPRGYLGHQDKLRQMKIRKDDVWVATFPRSGTTWTQEIVWLILNNLDYEKAKETELQHKYNFIEFFSLMTQKGIEQLKSIEGIENLNLEDMNGPGYLLADQTEGTRYIKTHLPFSLLPPFLLHKSKVVYVARDPRDVAVSFYYHNKLFKIHAYNGDFKTFWNLFRKDLVLWSSFFAHLKEAWALRHHPNMLFIFYEELSVDLKKTIKRIAKFYNKKFTERQIDELCDHVKFESMKNNKTVVPDWMSDPKICDVTDGNNFVRQGKVGGWRNYFDEEMTKEADQWIAENLEGTDILFPHLTLNPSQLRAL